MSGLRVLAGTVVEGDILVQPYDDTRGVVIEVVRLDFDRDHVGIRVLTEDSVSNALFHIFDIVTVAS